MTLRLLWRGQYSNCVAVFVFTLFFHMLVKDVISSPGRRGESYKHFLCRDEDVWHLLRISP